ncbi:MAG: Cna B-type domain-containing protein, partial [Clostridiales bacterium]|nr:Cna B-type domain-containing protein [Clostridiales bacterium]
YQESAANYIVMDDGVTIKGYTRYGAWHGDPYGDWSAAFVSFCLNYAEIPETEIPYEVSCNDWTDILSSYEWNLYRGAGGYVPKKGDIVFFDTNGDGSSDHAGIVKEFNAETARIETIEGNSANRVQYGTYTTDDFRICGYGALPEQGNKTYIDPYIDQINPEESVLPADDQINPDNDIIILEDIVLPEQEAEVPYTDATASYEYEDVIILEDIVLPEQENEVPYTDATSSYEYEDISIPEDFILSEQENKDLAEITKIAVIYTDENYLALLNDGTLITLTGAIPEEAEIRAFPVTVEAQQQVICAYDISIFMPDGTLFEPAAGEKINVSIQAPELYAGEASDATVYFIPEDEYSAPVPIDTSIQEDGTVCFETDHFSVYALMRSAALTEVYLNGTTGNDNNAGTQSSPLRTFEKALSMAAENGTIYVSGTVTVSNVESWTINVAGVKMQRASGFTGPLVTVANGGSLTLSNLTMNGGNGSLNPLLINNNSSYSTAYSANSAKAPLIVVNSGGALTITDDTVLKNNSNKPNTDANGAFAQSGYVGLGGAVYCGGTMTMTGGLIQNCEAQSGGGIYVENGSFRLSGGTIDNNYARNILAYGQTHATYRKNAGGGVYVGNNSSMVMSGGTVSNNQSSREGGGVSLGWLNRTHGGAIYSYTTEFTMTGGNFIGNEALSTGGGLNVTAGWKATVSAGYFTNNSAYGYDSQGDSYNGAYRVFSGGGIYVDAEQKNSSGEYAGVPGKLLLHRVVITQNHSDYEGGGIAACPTGKSRINCNLSNGTAIYNNTAIASAGEFDEICIENMNSNNDIICNTVLGGGSYDWTSKTSNGYTNFGNTLTDSSPEIITARSLATVWITDNHGYLGGGIGNNGVIEVGGESEETFLSFTITKVWGDNYTDHPDFITVQVLQDGVPYGDQINIYKTIDSNNQESWPTYYLDGLPDGHIYTIEEVSVPGYSSAVSLEGNNFTITNTRTGFRVIKNWVGDTAADRPSSIEVQLYQNGSPYGDPAQLTAANNWSYIWENLPVNDVNGDPYTYTVGEISAPEGYYCTCSEYVPENDRWEITNSKIEMTSVSAEKRWAQGTQPTDSVTLQLKADGQDYGTPVALNAANNWFYRWENLPKYTAQNTPIVYTVTEINIPGYWASIVKADPSQASSGWVQVPALENGKAYLLVNTANNIDRALSGDAYGLQFLNVTSALSTNTMPAQAALWTYNSAGSTLKNGDGRSIVLMTYSGAYYFYTSTGGGKYLSFTDGRLSAIDTIENKTRYLTGSISNNYALTSTNPADAMIFTFYTFTNNNTNWGETHYIVTNESAPGSIDVHFGKYAAGNDGSGSILIGGADLALYRQDETGNTIPGTNVTGTLVNQWTSGSVGQGDSIHIENLTQGTYYLIETAAPQGYIGLAGPIIFTVDSINGQVTVVQYPGYENMEGSNLFSGGSAELPVYNSVSYALPETGGSGTTLYTIGGIMLMMSAAVLLLYIHRKRGKEAFTSS